jgi:hypothetical protein
MQREKKEQSSQDHTRHSLRHTHSLSLSHTHAHIHTHTYNAHGAQSDPYCHGKRGNLELGGEQ